MKKLIVANWKMNPESVQKAEQLFDLVKTGVKDIKNVEVVVCPPFVYLPLLKGLTLGSQNVFYKEEGAFTGEVSAKQLIDLGVEYVIIGHSETRKYLSETDEIINKKIKEVLAVGLKPILCIGEKEGEIRDEVLQKQLADGLKGITASEVVIAYEPVWAIGTGNNCEPKQVIEAIEIIQKFVGQVRVLYGGSVNAQNAKDYLSIVDGLLVGGASLNAGEFIKIVKSVK